MIHVICASGASMVPWFLYKTMRSPVNDVIIVSCNDTLNDESFKPVQRWKEFNNHLI